MYIELWREVDDLPATPARQDDGVLGFERQHLLQHTRDLAQLCPRSGQLGLRFDANLPFPVVAHAGGFEDAG